MSGGFTYGALGRIKGTKQVMKNTSLNCLLSTILFPFFSYYRFWK